MSRVGLVLACALCLTACGGGSSPSGPGGGPPTDTPPGPVATIVVSPRAPALTSLGEVLELVAEARDASSRLVVDVSFTWTTSNPATARVSATNGGRANVTAVANGHATIMVTASGITATIPVSVLQVVAGVELTPAVTVLEFAGQTLQLGAVAVDGQGNEMSGVPVAWASSNPAIATVDASGLVTAQGFGVAGITAEAGTGSNQVLFEVIGDRFFLNGNVRLRYDLDLPDNSGGPFPAIVFVHGSGMGTRNRQLEVTNPLVPRGMAVLRYDKRGVGESTGTFVGVGPRNSDSRLRTLAGDAAAGAAFLKNFPRIDPTRIGLMANSQGGWISPLAASMSDDISYMMIWSGPTVSVGLEIFYSNLAEGTNTPLDDVYPRLPEFNGLAGYDPVPTLESLEIPSMWLFGGLDRSIPSRLDTLNMRRFQAAGLPYDFIWYPTAGHDLRDVNTGTFVNLWTDLVVWLRGRGILS